MKKVFLIIIALLGLSFTYIYVMDNRNLVDLPEGVITYEYDITKTILIPNRNGKYILIDTGYEKNYLSFKKLLQKDKIKISEITHIFITHHHDDHAGFLNDITNDNPSISVILHEKSIPLLLEGKNNVKNGGGIVNNFINGLFKFKQIITPNWDFTLPVYKVRDSDIILNGDKVVLNDIIGIDAYMLSTPGHTSDSISLIYKNQYAFCGDLASNILNFAGAKYLTIFNEDLDNVYESWQKLIDINIKYIIPNHGKSFGISSLISNMDKYDNSDVVPYKQ